MDSWKHTKMEGKSALLIPCFWADNIGSKRNAGRASKGLQGFICC